MQVLGQNVFRGELAGGTQVVFRDVPLPARPSADTFLRIVNLRADASRVGVSTTAVENKVTALVRMSTVPVASPRQALGHVVPGHSFQLLNSSNAPSSSIAGAGTWKVRFVEGSYSNFKKRNFGSTIASPDTTGPQNIPGAIYNSETGFYNPNFPQINCIEMGTATQGTRLLARFTGIPAGMGLSVSVNEIGAAPGAQKAQLIDADADGSGSYGPVSGPLAALAITNGEATAVWQILEANPLAIESLEFTLEVTGTGSASVAGHLAPLSTVNEADSESPLPRFATTSAANPVCPNFPCLKVPESVTLTSDGTSVGQANIPVQSDADPVPFVVTPSNAAPWLSILTGTGVTPATISVQASPTGLPAGTHTTDIYVNGRQVRINFNVSAAGAPALLVYPQRLDFTIDQGSTQQQIGSIYVDGTPGLNVTSVNNAGWVLVSANGATPVTATYAINFSGKAAAALKAGTYRSTVTFYALGVSPVVVPLTLTVRPVGQQPNSITGTVLDNAGAPIPGARVYLSQPGRSLDHRETDGNGLFQFDSVPASSTTLLTPVAPNHTFSPVSRTITNLYPGLITEFTGAPGNPASTVTVTPSVAAANSQTFSVTVRDQNGPRSLRRVYFVVNSQGAAAPNGCHGFYDRYFARLHLYDDALSANAPGVSIQNWNGILENSQCRLSSQGFSVTYDAEDDPYSLRINLPITRKGAFANQNHKLYIWAVDANGGGTGWIEGATWPAQGATQPTLVSASVITGGIRFLAADAGLDLSRAYFTIANSAITETNGCHGFYDYRAKEFYLFNDALTALLPPVAPGSQTRTENGRCAIDGPTSNVNEGTGEITLGLVRKGEFLTTAKKAYLWIVDSQNLGTGWLDANLNLPAFVNSPPAVANGTPSTAAGLTQQFSATINDPDGRTDLFRIYFLINPTPTIPQNSCHGFYDRATQSTYLYNDALTSASTTLENGQCRVQSVTAEPVQNSATGLTLSFTATRKGAYATGAQNVYLWAVDSGALGTGWVPISNWTVAPNNPPSVIAPAPPAVTGLAANFSFTARDADGASDLYRLYFLFNPTPNIPQNSCHGFYDRATNAITLYNDALSALLGPLTPGSGSTLQNTRCTIHGAATTVVTSGTDITLNLNVSINGVSSTNAYLWAVDKQNTGTGWVQSASWQSAAPNQPPTIPSEVQNFSGLTTTVTFTARDLDGASTINRLYFLFNATPNIPQNTCHGFYDRTTASVHLYNDALTALNPNRENSQCAIDLGSLTVTMSDSNRNLNVQFSITMKAPFATIQKHIYLWAVDSANAGTGWINAADWHPSYVGPPLVYPAFPSTVGGVLSASIAVPIVQFDPTQLNRLYFLIADSPAAAANGCHGYYDVQSRGLFLFNDALTVAAGSGSPQNSQCGVSAAGSSFVVTGFDSVRVTIPFTITSSFLGSGKKVYFLPVDNLGRGRGWVESTLWSNSAQAANRPPLLQTLYPEAVVGSPQLFRIRVSDPDGHADIKRIYFHVGTSATPTAGSCHGFYDRAANQMYLYNDALSGLSAPVIPGAQQSAENSQCVLNGLGSALVDLGGLDYVIDLGISLKAPFSATPRKLYILVQDNFNADSGWVEKSPWAPPTANPPSPLAATVNRSGAYMSVSMSPSDPDGPTNIRRVHIAIGADPAQTANSCRAYVERATSRAFLYADNGTALLGPIHGYVGSESTANTQCRISGGFNAWLLSPRMTEFNPYLYLNLLGQYATGTHKVWVQVEDNDGHFTAWTEQTVNVQ